MTLVDIDTLLKPVPLKDERVELAGIGDIRIRQLSMADAGKLSAWLFPGGELCKERQVSYGLKMATECLVDDNGNKLFDFPDTDKGNKAFMDFAGPINAGGGGHWVDIIEHVRRVNGGDDGGDLLEK